MRPQRTRDAERKGRHNNTVNCWQGKGQVLDLSNPAVIIWAVRGEGRDFIMLKECDMDTIRELVACMVSSRNEMGSSRCSSTDPRRGEESERRQDIDPLSFDRREIRQMIGGAIETLLLARAD